MKELVPEGRKARLFDAVSAPFASLSLRRLMETKLLPPSVHKMQA